ncbi:hypothetical protein HDU98_006705 [Podochytrium sp. JEL0797]|nr:hypothetical protein HDU98_006705 [Podochytrium sp. JEL0797]
MDSSTSAADNDELAAFLAELDSVGGLFGTTELGGQVLDTTADASMGSTNNALFPNAPTQSNSNTNNTNNPSINTSFGYNNNLFAGFDAFDDAFLFGSTAQPTASLDALLVMQQQQLDALLAAPSLPIADENALDSLLRDISASNAPFLSLNEMASAIPVHPFDASAPLFDASASTAPPVVAVLAPMITVNRRLKNHKKRLSVRSPTAKLEADDDDDKTDSEHLVFPAAKNPAEVFSQAAIKASTRRRTVEEPFHCIACAASIGILELRGTPASFEPTYSVNIRCKACCPESLDAPRKTDISASGEIEPSSGSNNTGGNTTNRKRRGAPPPDNKSEDQILHCQVCKRATAQGCVKMRAPVSSPLHRPRDPTSPLASVPPPATWVPPEFSVSLICNSCHTKYLFCSECGGGGKERTGKYRPRALFPANRRTCSLPHIRIGHTAVSHRVIEAPIALDTQMDILDGVRDVFFDCLVSLYAVPGILEGVDLDAPVGFGGTSLTLIHKDVEKLWNSTVRDAIVSESPKGLGGGKMYVTVAWIEKRNRNKGKFPSKKKKDEEAEMIPWLLRLAMEGTVAPLKVTGSGASSSSSLPMLVQNPQPPLLPSAPNVPWADEKTYISFAVSEWVCFFSTSYFDHLGDVSHLSIRIALMEHFSFFKWLPALFIYQRDSDPRKSQDSYGDLLRRNIERVQADARRDNAPPLEHIWCWTRNVSHSRLRSIPERLGFVPLEQYMREHPGVDRSTFTREGYQPLQEEGVSVHVADVRKFLQIMNKKEK